MEPIDEIPNEILLMILSKIHMDMKILLVCKRWKENIISTYLYEYFKLGIHKFIKGKHEDAYANFCTTLKAKQDKNIVWHPNKISRLYNFIANCEHKFNNIAQAIINLDIALSFNPNCVVALNNKGDNLNTLKKYEEAIQYFDRVLAIQPKRLSSLYNKGRSYLYLMKFDEAKKCFEEALKHHDDIDTECELACAELHLGNYARTIELCNHILEIDFDIIAYRLEYRAIHHKNKKCTCGRFSCCQEKQDN